MRALILSGYGINCEDETLNAFKTVGNLFITFCEPLGAFI